MTDADQVTKPYKCNADQLRVHLQKLAAHIPSEKLIFVCIGTDRSTGDALGPLVGTALRNKGFPRVIGTMDHPCDASNLVERTSAIPEDAFIIAIDACLGHPSTLGQYLVTDQPLQPAASVGNNLPSIGHFSIAAVVNINSPKPYWTLQTTSLNAVMRQAEEIAEAIVLSFHPHS